MDVGKVAGPTPEQQDARKKALIDLILFHGGSDVPPEQELKNMELLDLVWNSTNWGVTDKKLKAEIAEVDKQYAGGGKKRKSKRKKRKSHKHKSKKHKSKKHKSRRIRRK